MEGQCQNHWLRPKRTSLTRSPPPNSKDGKLILDDKDDVYVVIFANTVAAVLDACLREGKEGQREETWKWLPFALRHIATHTGLVVSGLRRSQK